MQAIAETSRSYSLLLFKRRLAHLRRRSYRDVELKEILYHTAALLIAREYMDKLKAMHEHFDLNVDYAPSRRASLLHVAIAHGSTTALEFLCTAFPHAINNTIHLNDLTPRLFAEQRNSKECLTILNEAVETLIV